jgi:hypothetical protein
MKKTNYGWADGNGYTHYEFVDANGNECSLLDDDYNRLTIFCKGAYFQLTQDQVEQLIPRLQQWLKDDSLILDGEEYPSPFSGKASGPMKKGRVDKT